MERVELSSKPDVVVVRTTTKHVYTTYNVGIAEIDKPEDWQSDECWECYSITFADAHTLADVAKAVHDGLGIEDVSVEEWHDIVMQCEAMDYGTIVSALVTARYNADAMQAIINNKLIGEDEDAFAEMQTWRVESKTLAKQIMNLNNKEE